MSEENRKPGQSPLLSPEEAQRRMSENLKKTGPLDNTYGLMPGLQKTGELSKKRTIPLTGDVLRDAITTKAIQQLRQNPPAELEPVNLDQVKPEDKKRAANAQRILRKAIADQNPQKKSK